MTTRTMAEEVCSALEQRCKSKQPAPNDMSHDLEASLAAFSQNGDTRPSRAKCSTFGTIFVLIGNVEKEREPENTRDGWRNDAINA